MMDRSDLVRCPDCGRWLPRKAYFLNNNRFNGLSSYCKECTLERKNARFLGISIQEWWWVKEYHQGRCRICNAKEQESKFHVDHDPKTGLVRGLLCPTHNRSLHAYDAPERDAIKAYHENPPFGKMGVYGKPKKRD